MRERFFKEMNDITVIMNGYKRPWLREQLEAIKNQSVKPKEILCWYNYPGDDSLVDQKVVQNTKCALCNTNFGVWARFAFALNAKTKYVCVFDDDTIPGQKWLENCVNTIQTNRGLLGTIGVIFRGKQTYFMENGRIGWGGPNKETTRVDLVGHSWFFEKEFLSAYWRELPEPQYLLCGEDMHFSYSIQKYLGLNTYVPPHPPNDKSLWGSIKGNVYGGGAVSLWQGNPQIKISKEKVVDNHTLMNEYFLNLCSKGWKLICDG